MCDTIQRDRGQSNGVTPRLSFCCCSSYGRQTKHARSPGLVNQFSGTPRGELHRASPIAKCPFFLCILLVSLNCLKHCKVILSGKQCCGSNPSWRVHLSQTFQKVSGFTVKMTQRHPPKRWVLFMSWHLVLFCFFVFFSP